MKRVGMVATCGLMSLAPACTQAPSDPSAPDAGNQELFLEARGYGIRVDLVPGWMVMRGTRSTADGTRVLSEARRPSRGFAVSPKLAFTVEPCPRDAPAQIFRDVLTNLRSLHERPGVRVMRTGLLTRTLPEGLVGEIDLIYRIESEDKNTTIVHRSLAMPRPTAPHGPALITLTATYLQTDAPRVAPEIDRIFASFRVLNR